MCIRDSYPEGHVDAHNKKEDITYLKKKVDAGCDYLTTQMFFDNNIYYNFLYRVREKGITVPIIPGIMPVSYTHLKLYRRNYKHANETIQIGAVLLDSEFKKIATLRIF